MERGEQKKEDQKERHWYHEHQAIPPTLQMLPQTSPLNAISRRQLQFAVRSLLGFGDKTADITASDVGFDRR